MTTFAQVRLSPLNSPWLRGVMLGLETAFRRLDKIRYSEIRREV